MKTLLYILISAVGIGLFVTYIAIPGIEKNHQVWCENQRQQVEDYELKEWTQNLQELCGDYK